jgi:predicted dehydrogenase
MKRKIAIVGLGAAARTIHLPAIAKLPELEIVAGADSMAEEGSFPFKLFASIDDLLEFCTPDILVVATPPDTHHAFVTQGLRAGCHVFCEKPFMETLEEADDIIALADRQDRHVVVNNQYRFMNIHTAAQNCIGTPSFGNLLFVTMHQTFHMTPETEAGWRGHDTQRTGKEFGIHALDLCRYFFGEEPISIVARMPKGKDPDGPDFLNLIQLEFSGDRVAHITLDRLSRGPHRYLDIRCDGSEGVVETSIGGRLEASAGLVARTRQPFARLDISMGGRARLYHGESFRKIASDPLDLFADATARLLGHFTDALDKGRIPPCDARDNRGTLALMLAAYKSDESRGPVLLAA